MFESEFLEIVRCPDTGSSLTPADDQMIDSVNELIREGVLTNRLGEKIANPLDGGLINEARSLLFPVRAQIPTLIADEAIDVTSLQQ